MNEKLKKTKYFSIDFKRFNNEFCQLKPSQGRTKTKFVN